MAEGGATEGGLGVADTEGRLSAEAGAVDGIIVDGGARAAHVLKRWLLQ